MAMSTDSSTSLILHSVIVPDDYQRLLLTMNAFSMAHRPAGTGMCQLSAVERIGATLPRAYEAVRTATCC